MGKTRMNLNGLTIKKKIIIVIACIMAVVSVLSLIVFSLLRVDDAAILNAMGRQRMLSQALAKSILGFNMAKNTMKNMEDEIVNLDEYITKMRGAYVKSVIAPAKKSGLPVSMSPDGETHPAVPFPATFTRFVNESFGGSGKMKVDIISESPINPKQSLKDASDREANDYLLKNKDKVFVKSVEENGNLFIRFYTADVATVKSCASCHSKMEGKNYNVGDMLGIRKFNVRFASDIALGNARLNPSLDEFETAMSIFTETLAAFKTGGEYPTNLTRTKYSKIGPVENPAVQSKISEIEKEMDRFNADVEKLGNTQVGSAENWKAQENIQDSSILLRKLSNDLVNIYEEKVNGRKRTIIITFCVLAIIALAGFVFLYFFICRSILNPLIKVIDTAKAVAKGDLTKKVEVKSNDEVGQLSSALNSMTKGLNDIVSKIAATSNQLASSSEQISASSDQMVNGAQDQTKQTDQVATAVEEMSATVLEVAKNSTDASSLATKASEVATSGGEIVKQAISGMDSISGAVSEAAETIESLGKSSDQIGEIIGVIDDIADQTNLLALNAAIEAARAGEQGRGFAVVADEVRKLAERTTKATKEIADMIKQIQKDTHGAVDSMKAGTEEVEKGVDLVNEAGNSLNQIVEVVQGVSDMIQQIATASQEQSAASEEISSNVEAVATITKESANSASETAHATDELSGLAIELKEIVGQFKLTS